MAHEKLEHGLPCYIDKGEMRFVSRRINAQIRIKRSPQRVRYPSVGALSGYRLHSTGGD